MRILLIEDDLLLGDGVKRGLTQHPGFIVEWVKDGTSVLTILQSEHFDAVLLDLGLPGKSGMDILKSLRHHNINIPVIILTARDTTQDRILGFDSGADDYLTKPFDLHELIARLKAIKRRMQQQGSLTLKYADVTLDPGAFTVKREEELINISRREFTILQALMEHIGQVLSRDKLMQLLYGWGDEVDSNTLEVYVYNLRKKLSSLRIRTIRGIGYMLEKLP